MIRDEAAINNETAKLFASFLDALGLASIGVGVVAPLIGSVPRTTAAGPGRPAAYLSLPQRPLRLVMGPILHGVAH